MAHDILQTSFDKVHEPNLWIKMTVGAFRWLDVYGIYRDLGWRPEPVLVVRDVRTAYASLMTKWYGFNGTTAETPPLRMRFRRFLQDWELFREHGWPIVKYEELLENEEGVLTGLCGRLGLAWDEGMIDWPKPTSQIAYVGNMNSTFKESLALGTIQAAKRIDKATVRIDGLPTSELEWLQDAFAMYNDINGYPKEIRPSEEGTVVKTMPAPKFEGTTRQVLEEWWGNEYQKFYAENEALRRQNVALQTGTSLH